MKKYIEAIVNSLSQLTEVPEDCSNLEMPSALDCYHFITNLKGDDYNSLVKKRIFRTNPNHFPCSSGGSTLRRLGAGSELKTISSQLRGGQQ